MTAYKLGKLTPKIDSRTLHLRNYLKLPEPPAEVSWVTHVTDWPMYLNDRLGCCVPAAMAHIEQQCGVYAQSELVGGRLGQVSITDRDVVTAYEAIGGYRPADPDNPQSNETDQGCVMMDALHYWRHEGIGGKKILAYMAVDWKNRTQVLQAIQLFGSLFVGIWLPITAQGEDAWTVANGGPLHNPNAAPGTWGGHCVPIFAASEFSRTCVTWGTRLKMSPNFFLDYVDEAYAVLSADWISKLGKSPGGFDVNTLLADLAAL